MLKKLDILIGTLSLSMIIVGGAIVVGDKAVRVLVDYTDKVISLIRKK